MRITEDYLVDRLHEFIDNCDATKLAELASIAFSGECIMAPWYEQSKDSDEDTIYVFDPGTGYHGELGESEFQIDDLEEE